MGEHSIRPWGHYTVVDEGSDTHKLKTIHVEPGQRLSLQSHQRRAEHWFIVSGRGLAWRNDEQIVVEPGSAVDIPAGARHRIESTGAAPLIFVEVQYGSYFGEDDIVRFADDYGRAEV